MLLCGNELCDLLVAAGQRVLASIPIHAQVGGGNQGETRPWRPRESQKLNKACVGTKHRLCCQASASLSRPSTPCVHRRSAPSVRAGIGSLALAPTSRAAVLGRRAAAVSGGLLLRLLRVWPVGAKPLDAASCCCNCCCAGCRRSAPGLGCFLLLTSPPPPWLAAGCFRLRSCCLCFGGGGCRRGLLLATAAAGRGQRCLGPCCLCFGSSGCRSGLLATTAAWRGQCCLCPCCRCFNCQLFSGCLCRHLGSRCLFCRLLSSSRLPLPAAASASRLLCWGCCLLAGGCCGCSCGCLPQLLQRRHKGRGAPSHSDVVNDVAPDLALGAAALAPPAPNITGVGVESTPWAGHTALWA